jgi:hypothetical protein
MAGSLRARVLGMALAGARDALETIEGRVAEQLTAGTKERQRERTREVLERDRALAQTAVPADPPVPAVGTALGAAPVRDPEPACSEPIRTRSMAKLLAGQGYPHRALAIYRHLLATVGDDATLRAEIIALQSHLGAHERATSVRAFAD